MGRFRIKFHMSKKQKVLLEIGVFILAVILFIGALNTVTATYKTPILTTEDLWKYANTTHVMFEFRNSTDVSAGSKLATYSLADVASYYDGYLYISIPYPEGFEVLRGFEIFNLSGLTVGDLIEHGVNKIYIYIEPINSTPVTFSATYSVTPLRLLIDMTNDASWGAIDNNGDETLIILVPDSAEGSDADSIKWKALFPDNGTVNREVSVDLGVIAIKAAGKTGKYLSVHRLMGDARGLEGMKFKLEIYAVSEKPVLKAISEPLYSFFAGLWSALLGLWRRVKSIVASAFGGFSLSAIFTGLIGDPVVALVLTIFMVSIFFLIMKPRR
ncbi:MAG: hypothetical protein ACXQTI_10935 [Candidatus Nezhaarchaeales archaeon]